jgi:hypothetical protein
MRCFRTMGNKKKNLRHDIEITKKEIIDFSENYKVQEVSTLKKGATFFLNKSVNIRKIFLHII